MDESEDDEIVVEVSPRPASRAPKPLRATALPPQEPEIHSVPSPPPSPLRARNMLEEGESTDLPRLLQYFRFLTNCRARFDEVTYVVNHWLFGGIVPMKHHGFIFKSSNRCVPPYLSLDFGRCGITWEISEECPGYPDHTCLAKRYFVPAEPSVLADYCAKTRPFSWFTNDCETWSTGMMEVLRLREAARCEEDVVDMAGKTSCSVFSFSLASCTMTG